MFCGTVYGTLCIASLAVESPCSHWVGWPYLSKKFPLSSFTLHYQHHFAPFRTTQYTTVSSYRSLHVSALYCTGCNPSHNSEPLWTTCTISNHPVPHRTTKHHRENLVQNPYQIHHPALTNTIQRHATPYASPSNTQQYCTPLHTTWLHLAPTHNILQLLKPPSIKWCHIWQAVSSGVNVSSNDV